MASSVLEACSKENTTTRIHFQFQDFVSGNHTYCPFRETIQIFLEECAEIEETTVSDMPTWSILFINGPNGAVFPLYIIEEPVQNSLNPFCAHCKLTGWGHHFVCKKKYHLIIPNMDHWNKPLKDDCFKLRTHILYGLIHCNGYGHLICINGLKKHSNSLSECDVMNFWDRICSMLSTREISIFAEMELRLLYVVAFGPTWFDKWGYKFSRESSRVTQEKYETTVEYLRSLGLDKIVTDFEDSGRGSNIRHLIDKYTKDRDVPLITFSDLMKFILECQVRAKAESKTEKKMITSASQHALKRMKNEMPINFDALVTSLEKERRSASRIELVLNEIVNILEENKGIAEGKYGVSGQDLRDKIRESVGDTGLIDFVLKSITHFRMGNQMVSRLKDPLAKAAVFTIQDIVEDDTIDLVVGKIVDDALDLNRNVLFGYNDTDQVSLATQDVFYCNPCVKEWPLEELDIEIDELMALSCIVLPSFDELGLARRVPPGEVVVVSPSITISELKVEAQSVLRDTYCIMENFVVSEIGGSKAIEEHEVISRTLKTDETVWMRGSGLDLGTKLRYQDGSHK